MRRCEQLKFFAPDGQEIFYRYWPASAGGEAREQPARALLLLHRGHEHSGRLQFLVDELLLPEYAMFAWDARGHGHTPGRRGYAPGVGVLVKDLDAFARHIVERHGVPLTSMAILAQSIGSVVAACWAHDYAPPLRAMVLAAPAFRVKLYVPFARQAIALWKRIVGDFTVQSYVKAQYLTHDEARVREFNEDPLITREISAQMLLDLGRTAERIVKDAAAIQIPTQVLISGRDWVVDPKPQREFFRNVGCAMKEMQPFPGFFHDTLGEKWRHRPISAARRFLSRAFADPPPAAELRYADALGFTKEEYERLKKPLPLWCMKRWQFALTRAGLQLGGRFSEGIRLGLERGFDSGASLDYVYRNQTNCSGWLGRMVDRSYLDAVGWRGIRLRKQNIEELLEKAMQRVEEHGGDIHVLDIAAGRGRYLLDAVARRSNAVAELLLRDSCPRNVTEGSRMIEERGLASLARFENANAFDRGALAALGSRWTVAIVSGLYELIPANAPVRESLAGLADAVAPGGYLLYTGQPWHPQLELIARTLRSHQGKQPWVMRRRTQAELDQLVEEAGFRKVEQLTDAWGMFTVSLAQRQVPEGAPAKNETRCQLVAE